MPQVLTAKGGGGGSPNSTQPGGSGGGRGSVPGSGTGGTGIQPQMNTHLTPLSGFNQYGDGVESYTVGSTGYNPASGGSAGQGQLKLLELQAVWVVAMVVMAYQFQNSLDLKFHYWDQ